MAQHMAQQQRQQHDGVVESALLQYAARRRLDNHSDAPSCQQVMNQVLREHQQDVGGQQRSDHHHHPHTAAPTQSVSSPPTLEIDPTGGNESFLPIDEAASSSSLAIDRSLLRYSTTRENYLGSGSFGDVYRGTYKGEKMAVKRIRILAEEMDGAGTTNPSSCS
jgi:hypothetical protein